MSAAARSVMHVMDIGGSHVTAATIEVDDDSAEVARRVDAPIDPVAPRQALLDSLSAPARLIGGLAGNDDDVGTSGWTVAIPGPFDSHGGSGSFDGVGKFASLAGVDLREALADRLHTRPELVWFVNDAVAYGVGEWAFGHVGRPRRMVCVTLGTGVGSAFLDNGRDVARGPEVPRDGDVHTVEYAGLPLERTVSSAALRAGFSSLTGETATVEMICARARAGDEDAASVVTVAMTVLGQVLAPWLGRFGASHLVIGGSISRSWDVIGRPIRAGMATGGLADGSVSVTPARLQGDAPLLGAAEWRRRES